MTLLSTHRVATSSITWAASGRVSTASHHQYSSLFSAAFSPVFWLCCPPIGTDTQEEWSNQSVKSVFFRPGPDWGRICGAGGPSRERRWGGVGHGPAPSQLPPHRHHHHQASAQTQHPSGKEPQMKKIVWATCFRFLTFWKGDSKT